MTGSLFFKSRIGIWLQKKRLARLWTQGISDFESMRFEKAICVFQSILKFGLFGEPSEGTQSLIGMCYQMQGHYEAAIHAYQLSLAIEPNSIRPRKRLAYLLATAPIDSCRDGQRALSLAQEAIALADQRDWEAWSIVAVAHAEAGEFPKAIASYQHAMSLMPECVRKMRFQTLDQLTSGKPIRCSPEFDRARLSRADGTSLNSET